ncbi:hypothetical protein CEXT_360051 [Caerostris extrusa]|uniref:Uncharacterized protein n=1 Tax=Caerostris extrusa TaxID=172846 RepID=A0AAV4Y9W5_CAEEX|nr:hypothetical protein CEXT_360051 [Caerostris extrusa]
MVNSKRPSLMTNDTIKCNFGYDEEENWSPGYELYSRNKAPNVSRRPFISPQRTVPHRRWTLPHRCELFLNRLTVSFVKETVNASSNRHNPRHMISTHAYFVRISNYSPPDF